MGVIADFARRVQAEKLEAEKSSEGLAKLNDAPVNQDESKVDADKSQRVTPPPYDFTESREQWIDVVEDINDSARTFDDAATGINDVVAELKETVEETKK